MGELAKIITRNFVEEETAISAVERYLIRQNDEVSDREDCCIHPSEVYDSCLRKLYYCYIGAEKNPIDLSPTKRLVFDTGHFVHHMFQRAYFKKSYGSRCIIEKTAQDRKLGLKGRADIIIDKLWGIDVKSMRKEMFERLQITDRIKRTCRPRIYDSYQANIYIKLLDLTHMWVLYYCKNDSRMLQAKITFNKARWKEVEKKCKYILKQAEEEIPPPFEENRIHGECSYNVICERDRKNEK